MAKKKSKKMNLIYMLIALVAGALTFISLAFSFIGSKITAGAFGSTTTEKSTLSLSEWFEFISDGSKLDGMASWQVSKIFLIITLVLVGLMLVGLLLNMLMKNKILGNCVKVVGLLAVVMAIVFFITTITGSSALSSSAGDTDIIGGSNTYYPSVAPYFILISTILSSLFACLALKKSK